MRRTVADAVTRLLLDVGVRRLYTVPGESYLELLDAVAREPGLTLVSTRHESGAAFMAEAEGKLTGVPAVAAASRGPGASNLAIGVHTAHEDRTPLIAVLGQVASRVRGHQGFQEVDLAAFYAPITKWCVEATCAAEVPGLLAEAFRRARTAPFGPTAVAVPADFWADTVEDDPHLRARAVPEPVAPPDPGAVDELGAMLDTARRPVAIVGPGAAGARDALRTFAEQHRVGVYSAFRRQDVLGEDHPCYLGHLGLGVPDRDLAALGEADLVLLLGTRLDAVTTQGFRYPRRDQRVAVVDPGFGRAGPAATPAPDVVLDATVADVVAALAARNGAGGGHGRATVVPAAGPDDPRADDPRSDASGLDPGTVVRALRRIAPADTIVTNDAGNFAAFVHRFWRFTEPRTQLAPANGAMGYGVPAAVAAKLAEPVRTVVAMVGDGGVLMTGQEIETAVRYGAAVVVLVFQNGLYGTIAMHQARSSGRLSGTSIGALDLAGWARGLGAQGMVIDRPDQVDAVLRAALDCGRPCVVDVRTDPDVITPDARLSALAPTRPADGDL